MTLDVHHLDSEQAVATLGPIVIRVIVSARTEIADSNRLLERVEALREQAARSAQVRDRP